MKIENEYTLKEVLRTGVNVFVGAGFSVGAKNVDGKSLPTGQQLLKELQGEFDSAINDLPNLCAFLETTQKERFVQFLTRRFKVKCYDDYYNNLNLINLRSIFTTNIDDLIPHIIAQNTCRYLNNNRVYGEAMDDTTINYLPLHGNVDTPSDGYVFGVNQLANVYNANGRNWSYFSNALEKYPTIFIGYKMADYSTIAAMTSMRTFQSNVQKDRWILLYNASPSEKTFFTSMGFNIIEGSARDFLEYLPKLLNISLRHRDAEVSLESLLGKNLIPKDNRNLPSTPIETFFRGMPPSWNDILSNAIYKTHYFKIIQESIFNPSANTIVIGSPLSGKTTLAMMVGSIINFEGYKFFFRDFTLNKAIYVAKLVGSQRALIIIDEFANDVDAFLHICALPNVSAVGVDRSQNFGNVDHLLPKDKFEVVNVTELTDIDVQGVLDSLPIEIKQPNKGEKYNLDVSLFEFVLSHIKGQSLGDRYKNYINELERKDDPLAEFLVLSAYMHYCKVPLSMEVAISYFSDEFNYHEVYHMEHQLADQLSEEDLTLDIELDGVRPRSNYLAKAIVDAASPTLLKKILNGILDNVYPLQIYNYDVFKKNAFDKELISRAFINWQEGKNFYERAFLYDNENPFVLQQGALYLSGKHRYKEAFQWIDRAMTLTHSRYFSIRNSHAIIKFEANYEGNSPESQLQMENSMEILSKCYKDDKRRTFHAITYANQAIRYAQKYATLKAKAYLETSEAWLKEEKSSTWKYEIPKLLKSVKEQLYGVSYNEL